MMNLQINLDQETVRVRQELLDACSRFENERMPLLVFMDAAYWAKCGGIDIRAIYQSPDSMIRAQLTAWQRVLNTIKCDNPAPSVAIDFGTAMIASAYGCDLQFRPGNIPEPDRWFKSENDLHRLESLDSFTQGLAGLTCQYYHYCREHRYDYSVQYLDADPFYPLESVSMPVHTDGPFSILCIIAGLDRVSMWCYDNPAFVKTAVEIITAKEKRRIGKSFELMGKKPTELFLADDYSCFISPEMFEEFVLPSQKELIHTFGGRCRFHSCIAKKELLPYWKNELKIELFNGFKPLDGLANLERDFAPVAESMAGQVLLEPDFDGANLMHATEAQLQDAKNRLQAIFPDPRGIKCLLTLAGGYDMNVMDKLNCFS